MGLLVLIGAVLIAIGTAGSAAACSGSPALFLAPLAGLTLAIGLVCVGVGIGNWRRPIPSEVRPANPWSDQPKDHGDPPVGQV